MLLKNTVYVNISNHAITPGSIKPSCDKLNQCSIISNMLQYINCGTHYCGRLTIYLWTKAYRHLKYICEQRRIYHGNVIVCNLFFLMENLTKKNSCWTTYLYCWRQNSVSMQNLQSLLHWLQHFLNAWMTHHIGKLMQQLQPELQYL